MAYIWREGFLVGFRWARKSLFFGGRAVFPCQVLCHVLGPVQTSYFCRAELNSGIKFDKSTAEARCLNQSFELSSALN